MNLPMKWLAEFTDVGDINIKDYCDRMTLTGSKVEGWATLAQDIQNVVVGKILTITPHSNSDHLLICSIDVGEEEPRQIVTGAHNLSEGDLVPVAKAPAKLPGGIEIKSGKLRGEKSDGMLCSIAELGLTLHDMPYAVEDGILILKEEVPMSVGQDIRDVLMLSDDVVEFEITPNRPDCLSVIGLARETGASFNRSVKYHTPTVKTAGGNVSDYISVEVKNTELCPRYTARVVRNVKIEPSPLWLRMRLRAAGVRPINNIVDITNYVMLEYGQPMHAFDYSCLNGKKIIVRNAENGENFRSLDSIDHTLKDSMLVIADESRAVALAGVMGGENSEITDTTATVVFESTNFLGSSVRLTSRALGMRTESSGRFEKNLDAEMTLAAVDRACELVNMLGAGEVVDGFIDVYGKKRETTVLPLESEKINSFLGENIPEQTMREIFKSLDFGVEGNTITVPSFRSDVECRADLAEEVLRIFGYDTVKATPFRSGVKTGQFSPRYAYRQRINDLLCCYGLDESYSFSFISPTFYDKIGIERPELLRIRNPLGEDTSVMRTVILPSLLESLARNYNYGAPSAGLFESASVYLPVNGKDLPDEPLRTVAAFYSMGDFYTMKGIVEAVLRDSGLVYEIDNCDAPYYHPGRTASMKLKKTGETLVSFGELHPDVADRYGFDNVRVYAAEFNSQLMFENADFVREYKALPKYPSVSRDLAFIIDEDITAGAVEKVMNEAGGKLVEDIKVFDVYRGKQLPEGKKSMAFNITLRAPDRTLTDEEADKDTAKIRRAVEEKLGASLR
ncbi:MAG: phenylalanine--tRNA ligase subunit beta [Clostridia bacterium]|nr:phenylalanine--tRNA ligase subunit beta [Clostridia bacterium]